jgi:hypothetical protein
MALQQANIKGVADIVLCVDCTSSMEPCITEVKNQIDVFIDTLENPPDQQRPVDWRLKIIGFRDLECDSEPWINLDAPMVNNAAAAKEQLIKLNDEGGGNEPESALDALWHAAVKTDWRPSCTKVVVLFSDATCHDTLHSSTVTAGAVGDDVSTVCQALADNGIHLFAWSATCPAWESLKKLPYVEFNPQTSGADGLKSLDFAKLLQILSKTVSQIAGTNPATKLA